MASDNLNGAVKGENTARRPYLPPPRNLFGLYTTTSSDNEVTDTGAQIQEQKGVNSTQQYCSPEEHHHADEIGDNAHALRIVKKALKKKLKKEMKSNLKKALKRTVKGALKMTVQNDVLNFSVNVDMKVRVTTTRLTSTSAHGETDKNPISNAKAAMRKSDTVSDTDGEDGTGERPVRQKLKETSIAGVKNPTSAPLDETMSSSQDDNAGDANERGRLRKKRSHDDCEDDDDSDNSRAEEEDPGHRRKRSRDSKAEDNDDAQRDMRSTPPSESKGTDPAEKILSPKKKRSRDQLDKDDLKSGDISEKESATVSSQEAAGEPEKKRHRDNSQERKAGQEDDRSSTTKTNLPNPFANTSSVSPFASLPLSKPAHSASKEDSAKQTITSPSAFASSSLAAFSGSEQSPFGSLASPKSSSVFKSAAATSGTGEPAKETTTSSSAFAASPFAAAGAAPAFGSLGGGFGSATGFAAAAPKIGGGLTSFAAPAGQANLPTASKTKVLGQASDDEDDNEEDDEEEGKPGLEGQEKEKTDNRFFEQQMETGEEEEESVLQNRAKLFHFDGKEWKERGTGVFRINVRHVADEDEGDEEEEGGDVEEQKEEKKKTTARLVMRADSVLRVILNIPIFKGMKIGDTSGDEPTGTHIHISGLENGKPIPLLLRVGNAETAKNIWKMVKVIIDEL